MLAAVVGAHPQDVACLLVVRAPGGGGIGALPVVGGEARVGIRQVGCHPQCGLEFLLVGGLFEGGCALPLLGGVFQRPGIRLGLLPGENIDLVEEIGGLQPSGGGLGPQCGGTRGA